MRRKLPKEWVTARKSPPNSNVFHCAGAGAKKRPIGNGGFGQAAAGSHAELNELRRKKLRLECAKLELEIEKVV